MPDDQTQLDWSSELERADGCALRPICVTEQTRTGVGLGLGLGLLCFHTLMFFQAGLWFTRSAMQNRKNSASRNMNSVPGVITFESHSEVGSFSSSQPDMSMPSLMSSLQR